MIDVSLGLHPASSGLRLSDLHNRVNAFLKEEIGNGF